MPTYKMPTECDQLRMAAVNEIQSALRAARCSVELAGAETDEFVVRELLLTVIQQLDRAAEQARRLHGSA